jgi:hypothetical protein
VEHACGVSASVAAAVFRVVAAPEMGHRMKTRFGLAVIFLAIMSVSAAPAFGGTYYVTVAGLGGEPDYEQRFAGLVKDLEKLLKEGGGDVHVQMLSGAGATRERLTGVMDQIMRQAKPEDDLIVILIGHGSFDGIEYKFNLPGPDISGSELARLCDRIPARRQLIVNTTSASGGAVVALGKPGRAVISATKAGTEKNATVFARYWVQAMQDPETDLDKNEVITAWEAFQYADRKTAAFYESQKRLATEHPVFDDTGKGQTTRVLALDKGEGALLSGLALLRLGATQRAANDPAKRELLARKEELETKIDQLKYEKAAMSPEVYKRELSAALVELARVQQELDK